MPRSDERSRRHRGSIDRLASGALRVRVYAGIDPVTKRRYDLTEVIPPGPKAEARAEAARVRLVNEVYERRNPRTSATVVQLLDRHLRDARLARKTQRTYRDLVDKHVVPFIGKEKVGTIDADVLDSLYAELNRCRDHCTDAKAVDHRTSREHECDDRCRLHECRPLSASSIRQIHWVLSGAFRRAQRLRWIVSNPMELAEPPARTPPNPRPPTPEEAAQIINAAWTDPDWGTLIWFLMVTGLRRGELCAIRWRHLDLVSGVLHLERSIGQLGSETWEKDAKTHADRRIVLDAETLRLLTEHRYRSEARAKAFGSELNEHAFVYSLAPDSSRHLLPDSVSQKYSKMVKRLGLETSIHKLRHYSATELIAAGVDVRTVAGRLGHAGGGSTTLRTYTAWISEADQRAAGAISARMPPRPIHQPAPKIVEIEPSSPYETVAIEVRNRIVDGTFPPGLPIPTAKDLAREYEVSVSTIQRAVALLKDWGLVSASRGKRTLVLQTPVPASPADDADGHAGTRMPASRDVVSQSIPVDIEIRRLDTTVAKLRTKADPDDPDVLQRLLVNALKRNGADVAAIGEHELVVRHAGEDAVLMTFVSAE
jgi:integrase/DNA-binding transcriptional regulator YhcF (GntR family)